MDPSEHAAFEVTLDHRRPGRRPRPRACRPPDRSASGDVVSGAVVGGVLVGASIGVAVDGALLELEEALSRDDFERELVTAVQQARREFADDYLRADVMSPQPQPQGKRPPGERGRQQPPG